jgi:hypothetical protein
MDLSVEQFVLNQTGASRILGVELIQELWSGFGQILKVKLEGAEVLSIIVKKIDLSNSGNHPRGWNTDASFKRKEFSYGVEQTWYKNYSNQSGSFLRMAKHLGSTSNKNGSVILLEDLDASGFPIRKSSLTLKEVKTCILWLANLHGKFMGCKSEGLWDVGTYWHLSTRTDEFKAMKDSELKRSAFKIDEVLNNCQYKTIVHGDAKVANFCFSEDLAKVAVVDFQYVGSGCGMKDLVCLLSSCVNAKECRLWEENFLDYYFECLFEALDGKFSGQEFVLLENEWRQLYPMAWADFYRFLDGWSPGNYKFNDYGEIMVENALSLFN